MLKSCDGSLLESYDLAMFDLDGVVYVSGAAIDGVPDRLRRVREAGVHLAFVTNNASRTPEKVAANLVELGIDASAADVVTSAQAAARVVRERFGAGARVLLLGGAGTGGRPGGGGPGRGGRARRRGRRRSSAATDPRSCGRTSCAPRPWSRAGCRTSPATPT